ncbi:MAG: ParA family protein [Gammaproteobacteria bacterium]|nr:ParA family protein [Gammaproteobacteria bacterium]
MTKIIGVVQVKGGAGRSTVATNLAASLADKADTVLIDCDVPQATSASWAALRQQQGRLGKLRVATAADHKGLVRIIKQLHMQCDYIILDGPPRMAELTRAILLVSDLCLIPLGSSLAEVWALADLLETLAQAQQRRPEVDARIVWNRYRGQTKMAKDLRVAVNEEIGLAQLNNRLAYRQAYTEVLARGLSVAEWRDKKAKNEFKALLQEIEQILESQQARRDA